MHFTAATGKVQVVDDGIIPPVPCSECDNPDTIDVTISGLIQCCSVSVGFGQSQDYIGDLAGEINKTHTLNREIPCLYSKIIDVDSSIRAGAYFNEECSGTPSFTSVVEAAISVSLSEDGTLVCNLFATQIWTAANTPVQSFTGVATLPCWDETLGNPFSLNCGDPGLQDDNFTCLLAGGTAVISETP
jgi:hypothetical protein